MARTTTWPAVRACGVCGEVRRIKRAAVDGDPDMCQACWKRDRRSWRVCGRCGELRPAQGRDRETGAPICERCYRHARPVGLCDGCGRERQLARTGTRGGPTLCGLCAQREMRPRRECGRCGRVGFIALLEAADGTTDLCFNCYGREPRAVCGVCGKLGSIHRRGVDGRPSVCRSCYRPPVACCSVCGRDRPCHYAATETPVCWSCKPRRIDRCVLCGEERPVKARSPAGPICERCNWRRLRAAATCSRCGEHRRPAVHPGEEVLCGDCAGIPQTRICVRCGSEDVTYSRGLCPRCSLHRRLDQLRLTGSPEALGALEPYLELLAAKPSALAVLGWFGKRGGRTLIDLAEGRIEVSHEALDAAGRGKSSEALRAELVHAGVLPERDELLARLERWTAERLKAIDAAEDQTVVRRFASWKVHRELADRRRRDPRWDPNAGSMPRHWIQSAIQLTIWVHEQGLTLEQLDQDRLDLWLTTGTGRTRDVRPFIVWLERHHSRRGRIAPARAGGVPVSAIPDAERLEALRRLISDDHLDDLVRVAGTLVVLYAQPAARIVRLTAVAVEFTATGPTIRLARDPLPLPGALAPSVERLRTRAAAVSEAGWLFPGQQIATAMHPAHLAKRLRAHGVPVAPTRVGALEALAFRIPAPVLAQVLGFHAHTTANASGRLKVDYAGYVANRPVAGD